jgi:formate hydrogenlyase subunit 6/NADH:ubiquinone oxidoreductase subunit I
VNAKDCILCRTCESQCPESAVQVFDEDTNTAKEESELHKFEDIETQRKNRRN